MWTDVDGDGIMEKQTSGGSYEQLDIKIITYEEPDYPSRQDAATLIAEQLSQVGFNVTIAVMEQSELIKTMKSGDYDLALVGYYLSMAARLYVHAGQRRRFQPERLFVGADGRGAQRRAYLGRGRADFRVRDRPRREMIVAQDLPVLSLYFRGGSLVSYLDMSSLDGLAAN